ncbi:MAG: hypothetical protein PHW82_09915, partial [Bacteroidales bacterium]|nr:hypothetical protein [Bacteroidales bacterium]
SFRNFESLVFDAFLSKTQKAVVFLRTLYILLLGVHALTSFGRLRKLDTKIINTVLVAISLLQCSKIRE